MSEAANTNDTEAIAEHLILGGIYGVLIKHDGDDSRTRYYLSKIVHLAENTVHIVIYEASFLKRPGKEDVTPEAIRLPDDINEARARHLAVSRKLFSLMRPVYISGGVSEDNPGITDSEAAGYRKWQLLPDKEVLEAPESFPLLENRSVYMRIFFVCGIPFGALQGAYHYYHHGWLVGLLTFLFSTAVFGAGMVLTQKLAVDRRLKNTKKEGAASAFQMAETQVSLPFSEAFKLSLDATRSIKDAKILVEDPGAGTIEAEVKGNISAEGESITVSLFRIDMDRSGVVVTSVPRRGGELDLGKNMENVQSILTYLSK